MANARHVAQICAAALCFVLALWGPQYARRGHWGPDEARFVYVAREMTAAHSPVIPLRSGEIYAHKPPLMMWLIQIGETIFGSPFGSRLPTLIGAFLTIVALYSIFTFLSDRRTALYAILLSATSIQIWTVFGRGQIDALLTGLVFSSVALFISCHGKVATIRILPAFLCAGLGILAKGPVGIILPVLIIVAIRLPLKDGRFPELTPLQWTAGLAVVLLVPALWLAAAAALGAPNSYFREIVFSQNVSRAGGGYGHVQPFWYLFAEFPVGFLPWTLILPAASAIAWRENRVLLRQCMLWALFILVFFTIPSSKRSVYILTAYPAAALTVAVASDAIHSRKWFRRAASAFVIAIPVLLLVMGFVLLFISPARCVFPAYLRTESIIRGFAFTCFVSAFLSRICAMFLFEPLAERHTFILPAISMAVILSCAGGIAMPALGQAKEPRALLPLVEKHVPPDGRLLLYRMDGELLALHAKRRGWRLDNDHEMLNAMKTEGEGLALFYADDGKDAEIRFTPLVRETGVFKIGKRKYGWARFAQQETDNVGNP